MCLNQFIFGIFDFAIIIILLFYSSSFFIFGLLFLCSFFSSPLALNTCNKVVVVLGLLEPVHSPQR